MTSPTPPKADAIQAGMAEAPGLNEAGLHIVIVLYNCIAQLPAFLDCLFTQTLRDWRLIAIDNASADGSTSLIEVRGDERFHLLRNDRNRGFAQAVNQGLREAAASGGALFLLLNTDTVFAPDFLERLLVARHECQAEVLSPRIMSAANPTEAWYAGGHLQYGWVFANVHEPYDPSDSCAWREVDFASGCCLLLRRSVLERVGLLDERFFVYWEDTDYSLRLKQAGIPIVYAANVTLLHEGGSSSGGEFSETYSALFYRSYMQLLRKHFGPVAALRSAARLLLKELGRDHLRSRHMVSPMIRGLVAPTRRTPLLAHHDVAGSDSG